MSGHFFEVPVKLVSRPGADYRAKCGTFTASCTASAEEAMQCAAAKAINASGKLAADVRANPYEIEIVGEGREAMARYHFDRRTEDANAGALLAASAQASNPLTAAALGVLEIFRDADKQVAAAMNGSHGRAWHKGTVLAVFAHFREATRPFNEQLAEEMIAVETEKAEVRS